MNPETPEQQPGNPVHLPPAWVRWVPLLSVVFIVIIVIVLSFSGRSNSQHADNDNPGNGINPMQAETTSGDTDLLRYIEDLGGPHQFIEGNSSATCRGCHLHQYDDWAGSTHANALTSDAFNATLQAASDNGSLRECIACHAPVDIDLLTTLPIENPTDPGITCVTCHSNRSRAGLYSLDEDREIAYPDTRSPYICESCHNPDIALIALLDPEIASEYSITDPSGNPWTEWNESVYSEPGENYKTCLDCHGQDGTGTLHRWPENKPDLVTAAYTVEIIPVDYAGSVLTAGLRITNSGAGHMFPTGDPGRLVVFGIQIHDTSDPDEIIYEQRFNIGIDIDEEGNIVDSRIPPMGSVELMINLPSDITVQPDSLGVSYVVYYMYDPVFAGYLEGYGIEPEVFLVVEGP